MAFLGLEASCWLEAVGLFWRHCNIPTDWREKNAGNFFLILCFYLQTQKPSSRWVCLKIVIPKIHYSYGLFIIFAVLTDTVLLYIVLGMPVYAIFLVWPTPQCPFRTRFLKLRTHPRLRCTICHRKHESHRQTNKPMVDEPRIHHWNWRCDSEIFAVVGRQDDAVWWSPPVIAGKSHHL